MQKSINRTLACIAELCSDKGKIPLLWQSWWMGPGCHVKQHHCHVMIHTQHGSCQEGCRNYAHHVLAWVLPMHPSKGHVDTNSAPMPIFIIAAGNPCLSSPMPMCCFALFGSPAPLACEAVTKQPLLVQRESIQTKNLTVTRLPSLDG